jgi:adenylate cyclase
MKFLLGLLKQNILPSAICFGIALLLAQTTWVQNVQNQALDVRTRWRASHQPQNDPRIAVVAIDDESIERIGRWPWPREFHGQFLALAAAGKASVVVWDILFTEPDNVAPQNDTKLIGGAMVAKIRGVESVFGAVTNETPGPMVENPVTMPIAHLVGDISKLHGDQAMLPPLPALQERAQFGLVDTPPGPDGVRRNVPLLGRVGDKVYFSLSMQALLRFWKVGPDEVRVVLGDAIYIKNANVERRIPIDETGRYFINYRFGLERANAFGFYALLAGLNKVHAEGVPVPDLPDISGKILLVGQIATALTDNGPTPFSGFTPLVLVHANVIENVLREDFVRRVPPWLMWLGGTIVGMAGLAIFSNRSLVAQVIFFLGFPFLYGFVSTYTWITHSLWLPIVWPVLGFTGLQVFMISRRLLAEQRAKAQIKGMFGTYISPALVNRMVESGEAPRLGGHEEDITAYFSDIQGFSTFSEKLPPDRLVELMNEYLTACTDIVQEEGGTLDKYIGDAVVAMFGAPIALPDHAYRACVAALRVQQQLEVLRTKWQSEGEKWPQIVGRMQSRIGLNSGACIIGNMGSRTRFNYTMMGDNVNLAARMESGAKSWGVYSMCTEATKRACEEHGGDRVVFRPLGKIVVKGRSQPVPVYEIVGLKENVTTETRECIRIFTHGLELHYQRDWAGAREQFKASAALEPHDPARTPGIVDNPSHIYLGIVADYESHPPPENWDGEYVMTVK